MKSTNSMFKRVWEQAGETWCKLAHPEPMWPIHGHYQCPECLRRYPVPWESEARAGQTPVPIHLARQLAGRASAGARAVA